MAEAVGTGESGARGAQMTRLETFADAAFAFAVTLLVVGGGDSIPKSFAEMTLAMKQVPAFAASFANIMLFWYAHHRWSRRYGLDDVGAAVLTMLLVFVVLIYVYPLKAIYSGALEYFTGGYLASYFSMQSIGDVRSLFVIFGAGYAALSGVTVLLYLYAFRQRESLSLSRLDEFDTVTDIQHWLINCIVPAISILLALTLPDRYVAAAGIFYMVLAVAAPVHAISRDRSRPKLD